MKFLNKIKTFLKKDKTQKNYNNLCDLAIELISQRRKEDAPAHLSNKEWNKILSEIEFGFECKQQKLELKSKGKRKIREAKVKKSFQLFEQYIKEL
jgi:hypothetical protein